MNVVVDRFGRVCTIKCDGEIDLATWPDVHAAIALQLLHETTLLCLDLEAVTFADSTGVRGLVDLMRTCAERDVRLELWPSPAITRACELVGLELPRPWYPAAPGRLFAPAG